MKRMVAIGSLGILLCAGQFAGAQTFQRPLIDPPAAVDRPTQRWLPLPQGEKVGQNSQARLLQQLQELMSGESSGSPLPKLSESQLQQMEGALEQLREQVGDDKLPNLEDIPREWINEALADPLIRKQAQQLLEQYSRDRKFPSPPRTSERQRDDAVPFPRRQPPTNGQSNNSGSERGLPGGSERSSQSSSQRDASRGSSSRDAADRNLSQNLSQNRAEQLDAPENRPVGNEQADSPPNENNSGMPSGKLPGAEGASPTMKDPTPKKPDAERIEALKQLFERLKKIEGDRKSNDGGSGALATPSNKAGDTSRTVPPRAEAGSKRPASSANGPLRPTSPTPRLGNPLRENEMRSRVPNLVPDDQQALPSDGDEADLQGSLMPKLEEDLGGLSSELGPDNPLLQNPKTDSAKSLNTNKLPNTKLPNLDSARGGLGADPRLKSRQPSGSQSRDGADRNASGSKDAASSSANSNANGAASGSKPAVGAGLDLKTQLERQGLGSALKSIVEKTLREQGELDSKQKGVDKKGPAASAKETANANKSTNKQPSAKPESASKSKPKPADVAKSAADSKPSGAASSGAPKQSQGSAAVAPPNQALGQGSSMSGLRNLAAEVWGAVRSTPGEGSSGSGSSDEVAGGAGADGSGAELGFSWGGAAWVLGFVVFAVLGLFLLLAKKRIASAAAARQAEATVAKELLADGIRTRADVVRAFHRFVLRRAQPVATWWNHRYVASRLTQATPQLGPVILDFASVYEQARYLPPEVELSSDDLRRVQSALKQCVAGSL